MAHCRLTIEERYDQWASHSSFFTCDSSDSSDSYLYVIVLINYFLSEHCRELNYCPDSAILFFGAHPKAKNNRK